MDFLYDNTFEGLLTALYYHFNQNGTTGIFPKKSYQTSILHSHMEIITNLEQSNKMYYKIKKDLSLDALKNVYHCFLSGILQKEQHILDYLTFGFERGVIFNLYHTHDAVKPILDINRKVKMECHRFLGYVRFRSEGSILYSLIHPTYHILPLLGNHFADRYSNESFIIHDEGRELAIIAKNGKWVLTPFHYDSVSYREKDVFEALWKMYFKTIAIENRKNLKLQQNFVPLKYKKDLLEFDLMRE
ncbi:MAG: TIGR03915 family putative DNA repair protein [Eubacteriales bacterium]